MSFAFLRGFITVKLQHIQRNRTQNVVYCLTSGIDEQTNSRDERRQRCDDGTRLLRRYRARAFFKEHQPDGIRPGLYCQQGIRDAGDTANLAANNRQRRNTRLKMSRMLTKAPPAASATLASSRLHAVWQSGQKMRSQITLRQDELLWVFNLHQIQTIGMRSDSTQPTVTGLQGFSHPLHRALAGANGHQHTGEIT